MTSQDINEILINPEALALVGLDELKELQAQFPYSQGFHFLMAKKLIEKKSPEFEASLHMASTYALDRRFLYDYLNNQPKKAQKSFEVNTGSLSKLQVELVEEEDDFEGFDDWVEDIESSEESKRPEIEADIDKRLKAILGKFGHEPEDQHLVTAVNRIRNMELGSETKSEKSVEIPEEIKEPKVLFITDNLSEIKEDGLETIDLVDNDWKGVEVESSIEFIKESEFSDVESDELENERLERLKAAIRKKHIERLRESVEAYFKLSEEQLQEEEVNVVLNDIPENVSFKDWFKSLKNKKKFQADDGIHNEFAASSLIEDDELMSEALAELLASQGNKARAAKMYQHLILKFPEKKRFFAQKIEDLS
jgi:hypothetical protein